MTTVCEMPSLRRDRKAEAEVLETLKIYDLEQKGREAGFNFQMP